MKIKWESLVLAILYIASGAVLTLYPTQLSDMLCIIMGIGLMIYGAVDVVQYFMLDLDKAVYSNEFSSGMMKIVVGVVIIYQKEVIQALIPVMLAFAILVSGFNKMQDAIDAKRLGNNSGWIWTYIVLALISIVIGVVLMLNIVTDTRLLQLAGIGLCYSGVTDLVSSIYISTMVKKYSKLQKKAEEPVVEEEPVPSGTTHMTIINADEDRKPEVVETPVITEPVVEETPEVETETTEPVAEENTDSID